jgi:hypothetical protein
VSLRDEWINFQFDPTFVRSVKEHAIAGFRTSQILIPVPPGDSKKQDKPDDSSVYFFRSCVYQQKGNSTCLIDAFCSAAVEFGCSRCVHQLRESMKQNIVNAGLKNIWGRFVDLVTKYFSSIGLRVYKNRGGNSVQDLLSMDDSFIIVASLKASDGSDGKHAIAIFNDAMYDANYPFALKKPQATLD